jgi:hypothetical protein
MKSNMKMHAATSPYLPRIRQASQLASSVLVVAGQRVPFLKPCSTFLLETRAFQSILQFAIPASVTMIGTHSLSGASVMVIPTGGSTNPAKGALSKQFTWLFKSDDAQPIQSYTVSPLPDGLVFTYGNPISSISGVPTTPGTYTVSLTGWEKANQQGDPTSTYTLRINVKDPSLLAPELIVEEATGKLMTDAGPKVNLGNVKVRKKSKTKTYRIKNDGNAELTGLAIVKDGKHATDFQVSALPSNSLAPGATATIQVRFKPKAAGNRQAAIHINNSATPDNPFDINLKGKGTK